MRKQTFVQKLRAFTPLLFGWLALSCQAPETQVPEAQAPVLAIQGATLIDGTGGPARPDSLVIVRGDTIEAVSVLGTSSPPVNAIVIDARGQYLLPGIIDSHSHIDKPNGVGLTEEQKALVQQHNLKAYLYSGITTAVTIAATDREWMLEQRRLARNHEIISPRLLTGLVRFTAPEGWAGRSGQPVASKEDVDRIFQDSIDNRADHTFAIYDDGVGAAKIYPRLDPLLMQRVADLSQEHKLPLYIHAVDIDEYRASVAVGPRAIVLALEDPIAEDDPLLAEMVSKNVFLVPSVVNFESFYRVTDDPSLLDEPILNQTFPDFVIASVRDSENVENAVARLEGVLQTDALEWARRAVPIMKENTKKFFDAGVTIAVGADSGGAVVHNFQGYNLIREFELLVECGLTPMDAIVAGTKNGAMMIGKDDRLGTIEPGKLADMILLNEDPLENISNLRTVDRVILNGKVFKRDELRYRQEPES